MADTGTTTSAERCRLSWGGSGLELEARRDGVRTVVALLRDGDRIVERSGVLGVLLPLPQESAAAPEAAAPETAAPETAAPEAVVPAAALETVAPAEAESEVAEPTPDDTARREPGAPPKVVVFSYLPGKINRAFLVVPASEAEAVEETTPSAPEASTDAAGSRGEESSTPATGAGGAEDATSAPDKSADAAASTGAAGAGEGGSPSTADGKSPELGALVSGLTGYKRGEQHRFDPPPGTTAARLQAFQRTHPKLHASRHVVLAVGKAVLGLLGVALLVQLVLKKLLGWILDHLPDIPWPDIALPSIPWPDIDLPDLLPDITVPGWLVPVLATAKYWVPVLFAIGLAVREARRRSGKKPDQREKAPNTSETADPESTHDLVDPETDSEEDTRRDAHR